jgi:hypothetical protein
MELMAEAAQMGWPERRFLALHDIQVLKGIVLEEGNRDLRISVRPQEATSLQQERIRLEVLISEREDPRMLLYRSTAELGRRQAPLPEVRRSLGDLEPFWTSSSGSYENWLFHGPRFQCIQEIIGISRQGIVATLAPSVPQDNLQVATGSWLMDPVIMDGGLQLALLWARNYLDITVLPSSFRTVHVFRPFHGAKAVCCEVEVINTFAQQTVQYNFFFTDEDGNLLGLIEEAEATGSKALNRIAGHVTVNRSPLDRGV